MTALKLTEANLAHLQMFQALLPQVRQYIQQLCPAHWPAFTSLLSRVIDQPLGSLAILPLASCAAVGGDPQTAIPVAAAWEVLNLAMRILDDLEDQDRPDSLWAEVGEARAFNLSAGLYALCNELLVQAPWPDACHRKISQIFAQTGLRLLSGQDRDLQGTAETFEDYWQIMQDKNAAAFAMACEAGALCGTTQPELLTACREFGEHLGMALQLFDDFQGMWEPIGLGDLAMGKITLPLLYGLRLEHPGRAELQQICESGNFQVQRDRILSILDQLQTREFIVWTALQEKQQAVEALSICPGEPGVTALVAYATTIFKHIDTVLPANRDSA
ncbi:polyprenyl synthetase family protein [Almyronema epifaneia]|uniref:Polyprenyl synthetase family protein n=1 Tax=Almyronema epifaneia S1 TaxID=2991925 RepID=A0ABW6IAJ5_9CYAN